MSHKRAQKWRYFSELNLPPGLLLFSFSGKPAAYRQFFAAGLVAVKAFSTFGAQVASGYHVYQQGAGCVFGIAKTLVQNP
jgi:hypothetical protein